MLGCECTAVRAIMDESEYRTGAATDRDFMNGDAIDSRGSTVKEGDIVIAAVRNV